VIRYLVSQPDGPEAIQRVEVAEPTAGAGEVLVELKAASLNFRDLVVSRGGYPRNDRLPCTPLSDGAGVVLATGAGVTRWRVGDRVVANFMRDWVAGEVTPAALDSSLGGGIDGVLAERFVLPAQSLVRIPDHLDFAEAATLPCAALTAWNALSAAGTRAGDTVLVLGTGGVSIFGIQFARALGAVPIVTSSSDAKLERARALGAAHGINYRSHPEWHEELLRITAGRGVDHVLETGGPGTLERSIASARIGGSVNLIGILADGTPPSLVLAMLKCLTIRGIYVGSVEMFEAMNRAIEAHALHPVIDSRYPFDDAVAAYQAFASQQHVGKVVIVRE
jgi:NADPH:quinone reductase-like Zn-dependent oxidoreductase